MANRLRGGQKLWTSAVVGIGDVSAAGYVDGDQFAAVFISNTGGSSTVITIQASDNVLPTAGRNTVPTTWYDYLGADAVTVGTGKNICFDLSPFGPSFIRLKTSTATTLDAFLTVVG